MLEGARICKTLPLSGGLTFGVASSGVASVAVFWVYQDSRGTKIIHLCGQEAAEEPYLSHYVFPPPRLGGRHGAISEISIRGHE